MTGCLIDCDRCGDQSADRSPCTHRETCMDCWTYYGCLECAADHADDAAVASWEDRAGR